MTYVNSIDQTLVGTGLAGLFLDTAVEQITKKAGEQHLERAKISLVLPPERRDEIVAMLSSLIGPVNAAPGCLSCGLYYDVADKNTVCWEEAWETREDLHRHVASTRYRQILAALDLAIVQPEIHFEHVTESRGMDLIATVRLKHKSSNSDL